MSWLRHGRRAYYYRKCGPRSDRKVEYLGNGPEAYAVAAAVEQRKADRLKRIEIQIESKRQEARISVYHRHITTLYDYYKVSEGYHKDRSEWRKTGTINRKLLMNTSTTLETAIAAEKARRAVAAGKVQEFIDRYNGHADKNALECLLYSSGLSETTKAAYRPAVQQLFDSLAGPDPSPLVKIMAMRVAIGWMDVYIADSIYYLWSQGQDIQQAEFYDRRRGRAAKRLLQAVRCLADIQRVKVDQIHAHIKSLEFSPN